MVCMCEAVELEDGSDGYFYCQQCGNRADGVMATAVDNDEMPLTRESVAGGVVRRRLPVVKLEPLSQSQRGDGVGPTEPVNFEKGAAPSYDDYFTKIRKTYVMGVQMMIQLQIKALVEEFKACPVIVDIIEPVWLRFVASTNLLSDDWDSKAIEETESQVEGEIEAARAARKGEPCNLLGKRCVMIWYRSLSNAIPLSYSLAISFLACHLAREPILSTDIVKWALEGKLPYFAAFLEINKLLKLPTPACPLTSSRMFRPTHAIPLQKLEVLAASIAQSIGLELPPVNFSAIASRYLKQLSLPGDIILSHACRIYEWSMPPELWLSANEFRLPTHAFVLSILIVSIRILYNIHGFGKWEMSLSCALKGKDADELSLPCSSQSDVDDYTAGQPCKKDLDATEIIVLLESKHNQLIDASDHAKDLKAYLEFCENVVFAGVELSYEEDTIIKGLMQFYEEKKKHHKPSVSFFLSMSSPNKRPQDHSQNHTNKTKKPKDDNVQITLDPKESHREREIRRMKSNMEENKFCYIPPRKRVRRHDYLHYTRKKGDGAYVYAAHADYYIILRSCARVAQLDVRNMHAAVLSFERRLGWLEKNIQHSLKIMPYNEDCELCDLSSKLKV